MDIHGTETTESARDFDCATDSANWFVGGVLAFAAVSKRLALRRFWVRRCSGSFSSSGTTSFNGSHDASKSSPAGPAALGASARRHGLEGAGSALQSAQDLVRHIV